MSNRLVGEMKGWKRGVEVVDKILEVMMREAEDRRWGCVMVNWGVGCMWEWGWM